MALTYASKTFLVSLLVFRGQDAKTDSVNSKTALIAMTWVYSMMAELHRRSNITMGFPIVTDESVVDRYSEMDKCNLRCTQNRKNTVVRREKTNMGA